MTRDIARPHASIARLSRWGALLLVCALGLVGCYTDVDPTSTAVVDVVQAPTTAPAQVAQPPQTGGAGAPNSAGGGGGGGGAATPAAVKQASPARTAVAGPPRLTPSVTATMGGTRPGANPPAGGKPTTIPTVRPGGVVPPSRPGTTGGSGSQPGTGNTTVVTVQPGEMPPAQADMGVVFVTKHENFENRIIPGACFALVQGETTVSSACDQQDGDLSSEPGVIGLQAPAGNYVLRETTAPEGYEAGEDVDVVLAPGTPAAVDVINHLAKSTDTLVVRKLDPAGTPLAGACFDVVGQDESVTAMCDGDPNDAAADPGVIQIEVPAGDYTLRETPPAGFVPTEVTVNVERGSGATVDVVNQPATPTGTETMGVFIARIVGPDGTTPLPGACLTLDGPSTYSACDNGDGDVDPTEGTIDFDVVLTGEYTLTATPPDGMVEAASMPRVTVTESGSEPVTLQFQPAETGTTSETTDVADGVLLITATLEDGETAVPGVCLTLTGPVTRDICDNGDGDQEPTDGTIELDAVAPGDYQITVAPLDGFELAAEIPPFSVESGALATVSIQFRTLATSGAVQITVIDTAGQTPVGGACFDLNGQSGPISVCDDDQNDWDELVGPDAAPGVIVLADVPPGDYTLHQSTAPEGYDPVADQPVQVAAGQVVPVTVSLTATAPVLGALEVGLADEAGNPVPGACVSLSRSDSGDAIAELCDGGDGDPAADGSIAFADLEPGSYQVSETSTPAGYLMADPVQAEIPAEGGTIPVSVVHRLALGSIEITTTGPNGEPVPNACYSLLAADGSQVDLCDDDGDGRLVFDSLAAGDYTVRQGNLPADFAPGEQTEQVVTVTAGESVPTSFSVLAAAPETASLVIAVTDDAGQPVAGACFELAGPQPLSICDDAENDADPNPAVMRVDNLPPGEYTVSQLQAPEGHALAEPQTVALDPAASPADVSFVNSAQPSGVALTSPVVYGDDAGRLWLLRPGDAGPIRIDSDDRPFDPAMDPVFSFDDARVAFLIRNPDQPAANVIWLTIQDLAPGAVDFAGIGTPRRMAWVPGSSDVLLVAVEQSPGVSNLFFFNTATSELSAPVFPAGSEPQSIDAIIPSPSTTLVAIQTTRADGNADTWLFDAQDPAAPGLIAAGPNDGNDPDFFAGWAPSGDAILLRSGFDAQQLYLASMAGTSAPLDPSPVFQGDVSRGTAPSWSPDGGMIAFFDNDPAAGGLLHIVRADGSPLCDPIASVRAAVWSPRDPQLWMLVDSPDGPQSLIVVGGDCGQQPITGFDAPFERLEWDPTGSTLALVASEDGNPRLALLEGTALTPIDMARANVAFADTLGWSTGGDVLAIYAGGPSVSLWVVERGADAPAPATGSALPEGATYVNGVWWP